MQPAAAFIKIIKKKYLPGSWYLKVHVHVVLERLSTILIYVPAGTYTLGVYGESGSCSSTLVTQTLTITDPSTLTIDTGLTGDAVCEGDSFTITVDDTQSSNTTYTLSYPGGPQIKNSSTGQVTFTLSLAAKGEISVVSIPAAGCGATVRDTECSELQCSHQCM